MNIDASAIWIKSIMHRVWYAFYMEADRKGVVTFFYCFVDQQNSFNFFAVPVGLTLIRMLSFIYYLHRRMIEHEFRPLIMTHSELMSLYTFFAPFAACQWRLLWAINYLSRHTELIARTEKYRVSIVMSLIGEDKSKNKFAHNSVNKMREEERNVL